MGFMVHESFLTVLFSRSDVAHRSLRHFAPRTLRNFGQGECRGLPCVALEGSAVVLCSWQWSQGLMLASGACTAESFSPSDCSVRRTVRVSGCLIPGPPKAHQKCEPNTSLLVFGSHFRCFWGGPWMRHPLLVGRVPASSGGAGRKGRGSGVADVIFL